MNELFPSTPNTTSTTLLVNTSTERVGLTVRVREGGGVTFRWFLSQTLLSQGGVLCRWFSFSERFLSGRISFGEGCPSAAREETSFLRRGGKERDNSFRGKMFSWSFLKGFLSWGTSFLGGYFPFFSKGGFSGRGGRE